jgi:hypothetical protein
VRKLRADETAADAECREISLVAEALGELDGAAEDGPGVEAAQNGLGVEVYDRNLLRSGHTDAAPMGTRRCRSFPGIRIF